MSKNKSFLSEVDSPLRHTWLTGRVIEVDSYSHIPKLLIAVREQSIWFSVQADVSDISPKNIVQFELCPQQKVIQKLQVIDKCQHASTGFEESDILRWRHLGHDVKRMARLKQRHQVVKVLRETLDEAGYLEVQTPLLVKAPNPEAHFEYLEASGRYLITSPEFHMKRMLVGGFEKIYQLSSCFRGQEKGRYHNPEFTMLEWYHSGASICEIKQELEGLIRSVIAGVPELKARICVNGKQVDWLKEWNCVSVAELFESYWGIDIQGVDTAQGLKECAIDAGVQSAESWSSEDYSDIFYALWEPLESSLGIGVPCFVKDWPLPLASLAQANRDVPGCVERVELYVGGVEVANGFGELTDPAEQQTRFEQELQKRKQAEKALVPLDKKFLASIREGLPPSAGMAMGVDRLVMLLTEASSLKEVLAFDDDEL